MQLLISHDIGHPFLRNIPLSLMWQDVALKCSDVKNEWKSVHGSKHEEVSGFGWSLFFGVLLDRIWWSTNAHAFNNNLPSNY
jgi:hypothetical protein